MRYHHDPSSPSFISASLDHLELLNRLTLTSYPLYGLKGRCSPAHTHNARYTKLEQSDSLACSKEEMSKYQFVRENCKVVPVYDQTVIEE